MRFLACDPFPYDREQEKDARCKPQPPRACFELGLGFVFGGVRDETGGEWASEVSRREKEEGRGKDGELDDGEREAEEE